MMTHDDAFDLLAPLALHALDGDMTLEIESHVVECPRCQLELDSLLEVASAMGSTYQAVPEDLWSKISSRLYEREGADSAVVPELAMAAIVAPAASRHRSQISLTRRVKAFAGTVSIGVAAAIAALSINLVSANGQIANLAGALNSGDNAVTAALTTPGHKIVTVTDTQSKPVAQFVMLRDGRGYLISTTLPTLPTSENYQLWAVEDGTPVSLGLMGNDPHAVAFTTASSVKPTALGITIEPAAGAQTPAKTMVGLGLV